MSEVIKDFTIKLFGKTIALLPDKVLTDITVTEQRQSSSSAESTSQDSNKYVSSEFEENRLEYDESIDPSESTMSTESSSEKTTKNDETTGSDDSKDKTTLKKPDKLLPCLRCKSTESSSEKTTKNDETTGSDDSKDKTTLKKPDKLLPCPRCKSTDTKFCYYNNYNVKQPRHFCKKCQRYWTSGGTMRNVPVGSGRRKNKNAPAPNYHNIMVLDTLREARPEPTNGLLMFGPNGPRNNSGRVFGPSGFPVSFNPSTTFWGPHLPNPKSLRIDDPNEAAKSSVWTTLGIKNEKIGSNNKMRPFEAFETKAGRNRNVDNTTMALYANPAALSRSLNFHERAQ